MYKIRGEDGKEYGPVSADTLRTWVNQGRANPQTFVLAEGATEWKTLSACPEFANLFAAPPPGMTRAVGSAPIGPAKTSGMAITSLVMGGLSILSCGITLIVTTPLGLILGLVAMNKIKNSQGKLSGRGLALAGTIVSGVSVLLIPINAALLLPALSKAHAKAQSINCMNNARTLCLAAHMYSGANSNTFPLSTNWCDAFLANGGASNSFICPGMPRTQCGYAYNSNLSGLKDATPDPYTVMFFESDGGWNASGGKGLMITKPRHGRGYIVGFADGHCEVVTESRISQLRWDPKPGANNNQ